MEGLKEASILCLVVPKVVFLGEAIFANTAYPSRLKRV